MEIIGNATTLDRAHAKAEHLNAKLAKLGIDERYVVTSEAFVEDSVRYQRITVTQPKVIRAEWEVVGKHTAVADSDRFTTSWFTGAEYAAPTDRRCDHCGTMRARKTIYTLRHLDDNAVQQLGSTCLQPFLGLSIRAVELMELNEEEWDSLEGRGCGGEAVFSLAEIVAVTELVIAEQKAQSYTPEIGKRIADIALNVLMWDGFDKQSGIPVAEKMLEWAGSPTAAAEATGSYLGNVRETLLAVDGPLDEGIGEKQVRLVASAISRAQLKERASFLRPVTQQQFAPEGTTLLDLDVTVVSVYHFMQTGFGYRAPDKPAVIVRLQTESGHLLKWTSTAKKALDLQEGADMRLVKALVRDEDALDEFNGDLSTKIRLAKLVDRTTTEGVSS